MSTDLIFLYGTLKKGFKNPYTEELITGTEFLGTGHFAGELYLCDWFPAALHIPGSPLRVYGEIYRMLDAEKLLLLLDEYEEVTPDPEKSLYIRKIIQVQCQDNTLVSCYVYIYNQSVEGFEMISGGNFIKKE